MSHQEEQKTGPSPAQSDSGCKGYIFLSETETRVAIFGGKKEMPYRTQGWKRTSSRILGFVNTNVRSGIPVVRSQQKKKKKRKRMRQEHEGEKAMEHHTRELAITHNPSLDFG